MKRFSALWLCGLFLRRSVLALSLPLAASVAVADEPTSPTPAVSHTLGCEAGPPTECDAALDCGMPAETPACGDAAPGCASECAEPTSCWTKDNLICDNWAEPFEDCGVVVDLQYTNFYQGVARGGQEQNWEYGGKLDYFVNLDGHKMGLWKGLSTVIHAETRVGEDVNLDAVGLAPVNANMLYPNTFQNNTAITGFVVSQQVTDDVIFSVGKYNLLDLLDQLYPQTGRGIDGFMNISNLGPLSLIRTVNLSVNGAGVMTLEEGKVKSSLSVLDTNNSSTTSGISDLFDNGAVILGFYRWFHELGDLPGSHAIMGAYSSGTYTSLDATTWAILPETGTLVAGQETDSWNIEYIFDQKLWVDSCNPKRNIGLLTMWGIADDNPSPVRWAGNVAIQAEGMVASRPGDTMGVAWFHTDLSGEFINLVSPVTALHNVSGIETYYNAAITPWFHLTGDLQVIEPAEINKDTAIVVGLRANFNL